MNPRDNALLVEYVVRDDDEQATEAAPAPEIIALKKQRDELLEALTRLEFAAQCRDNTSGDPCRLMVVKAELAEAAAQARAAIAKAGGEV